MRKVVLLEHISLDGLAAGPHGEIDWIRFDEELWEYVAAASAEADTAIYGRKTYEMMEGYWPTAAEQPGATKHDIDHARWVNAATKLVFTNTLKDPRWQNTRVVGGDVAQVMGEIKQEPGTNMLMIGSLALAREFMAHGLIDEFWLNVNPVVLGQGTPLFGGGLHRSDLDLVSAKTFAHGVVALRYKKRS